MPASRNRIAYYRDRCAPPLTQAVLALALGKHVNSVQLWEKQGAPSPAMLLRLVALFVERGALVDEPTALSFWQISGRAAFPVPPELHQLFAIAAAAQPLPTDALPPYAPLPTGSLLPLHRNPLFIGRTTELLALAAALAAGDTAVITGMGGLGKTQLAAEFAHRYGRFFGGGVFWLSFADPIVVPSEVAACGGAGRLDLRADFSGLPFDDQMRLVQAAWQSPVARLLIFDNCEDEALFMRWRPTTGGCRMLLTSQRSRWNTALGLVCLPLAPLARADSIALLCKRRVSVRSDAADLHAIAAELGDLPLALHLAGSFLDRYRNMIGPAEYLAQMRGVLVLAHQSLQSSEYSPTGHQQSVVRTFALSYEHLQTNDPIDRLAHDLLLRAACFAPGEPIPRRLLLATITRLADEPVALAQVEDALARLVGDLGLLELGDAGTLRMHRLLVAFVVAVGGDLTARADVEQTMLAMANRMNTERLPAEMLALRGHLQAVTDAACVRADACAADLCAALGWQLVLLSAFDEAEAYLRLSLTIREQLFGDQHPSVADSLNLLGLYHQFRGALVLARTLYERALGIWQRTLGPDHSDTGSVHNNLGYLLFHLEAFDVAQAHLRRALAIYHSIVGIRHPSTARTLNNLGYVLLHMGKRSAARRYLKLALAIRRQVLPNNHLSTAQTLNNLGETLFVQGDYYSAQRYHEQALVMRDAVFGCDHFEAAESLRNLGNVRRALGDHTAARNYLERALAICVASVGEQHIDTAWTFDALGELIFEQADYPTAQGYFERALAVYRALLPLKHRNLVRMRDRLAEIAQLIAMTNPAHLA